MPFHFKSTKSARHKVNPKGSFLLKGCKWQKLLDVVPFLWITKSILEFVPLKTCHNSFHCHLFLTRIGFYTLMSSKIVNLISLQLLKLSSSVQEPNFSFRHSCLRINFKSYLHLQLTSDFTCTYMCKG